MRVAWKGLQVAARAGWALLAWWLAGPACAENLLQNPGFENGLDGWSGLGAATLSVTMDDVHGGDYALLVSGRDATWQGPVQSLLGRLEPGRSYQVSAWVKLAGGEEQPLGMTVALTDQNGERFINLIDSRGFSDRWVQLTEVFRYQAAEPATRLDLYLQGPAPGVDFLVDDVLVEALPDDWRTDADQRIEAIRKRNLTVRVLDADGNPVPGATVELRQLSRLFPIGTALNASALSQNATYRNYVTAHFNWGVHENAAKWYSNEPQRDVETYADADAVLDWADGHGITMRGHTLFWAPQQWQPSWVPGLSDEDLSGEVTERLEHAVTHFKGRFRHWDVNNEMLHGSFFADRLGEDIRQWMYGRSRELDPDADLFVNEYNVLSGTQADLYALQVRDFLDRGFPIDGIGLQGHFNGVDPWAVKLRLDKMAQLGLPLWVTEFDVKQADENDRADALEALMRTAFSHPAVHGIILWGFWAGAHWRGPDAALVDLDWRVNAAGQRFDELLTEWSSNPSLETGADGLAEARVFHGRYRVRAAGPGGLTATTEVEVNPGGAGLRVDLLLAEGSATPPALVADFGGSGTAAGRFDTPGGVAVDSQDRLVVADALNNRIQICGRTGSCQSFGGAGTEPGQFCNPADVAVDSRDRILVADSCNHRVQVCNDTGACTAFGGPGQFNQPVSVAVDSHDRVVVGDSFHGQVQICDRQGDCDSLGSLVLDPAHFQAGEFGYIQSVAVDEQDRILLTEDIGGDSRKGLHTCYHDACGLTREFGLPRSVAVDRFNRIHVIDDAGLQRCDHAGRCTPVALAPVRAGSSLAFTHGNELVVSDPQEHRVRVYALPSAVLVNAAFNDAWFEPSTAGQGFFVNAFPLIGKVFMGWFTFDLQAPDPGVSAVFGGAGQRWLTALGDLRQNRAELAIELTSGGVLGAAEPSPVQSGFGRVILQFDSCSSGTVSFEIPAIDAWLQVIPIQRVSEDNVALCEALQ